MAKELTAKQVEAAALINWDIKEIILKHTGMTFREYILADESSLVGLLAKSFAGLKEIE